MSLKPGMSMRTTIRLEAMVCMLTHLAAWVHDVSHMRLEVLCMARYVIAEASGLTSGHGRRRLVRLFSRDGLDERALANTGDAKGRYEGIDSSSEGGQYWEVPSLHGLVPDGADT